MLSDTRYFGHFDRSCYLLTYLLTYLLRSYRPELNVISNRYTHVKPKVTRETSHFKVKRKHDSHTFPFEKERCYSTVHTSRYCTNNVPQHYLLSTCFSPPVLQYTGTKLLQVIFGIVGKVILCRIIMQVAPLIPAWDKMLQTKIR